MLLSEGRDQARGWSLLADVRRTADELDLTRLRRQAEEAARRQERATPPDGLTRRELDVLRLLGRGLSNKAIAAELVVSINTVERHLVSIYRKIGVAGRAAAAVYAHLRLSGFP